MWKTSTMPSSAAAANSSPTAGSSHRSGTFSSAQPAAPRDAHCRSRSGAPGSDGSGA